MYAQRGHGRRSSKYSDFTFGAWQDTDDGRILVPVGKAYSGFTDAELQKLDKFVRDHTTAKFGPVREVEQKLVIEAAFLTPSISQNVIKAVLLCAFRAFMLFGGIKTQKRLIH